MHFFLVNIFVYTLPLTMCSELYDVKREHCSSAFDVLEN